MTNVSTCLWFDGTAHEAATRYVEIVGGSSDRVTHYPDLDVEGYPPVPAGSVATVEFHLADTPYLALNGGPEFPPDIRPRSWSKRPIRLNVTAAGTACSPTATPRCNAGG